MMVDKPLPPLDRAASEALAKRRRGRNWAMFAVLVGIAVLFYAIAVVKLAKPDLAH